MEVFVNSQNVFDIHDYPVKKGGNGIPDHFTEYECPYCKKNLRFKI